MVSGSLPLQLSVYPLSPSQPSLVALLTVGKVGPLGAGDCNGDGGLHTIVGPADVLACVSW